VTTPTPSPEFGGFRWARYRAAQLRRSFWVGTGFSSLIIAVLGAIVVLPTHPTVNQKLLAAVIIIAMALAITVVATYA
jgi:uncharacterized membrane protein YhaH (DUF805 family)